MPTIVSTTNKLESAITNRGESLHALSLKQPVLLVFLRHFGCTFCREALDDLAKLRPEIEAQGARVVLVHLADEKTATAYFKKYGLHDVDYITDPEATHYASFGLLKGNFNQLFGLKVWMRTVESAVLKGHGGGGFKTIGDGFQMPGVFLIHEGKIIEQFVHKYISDRPDYMKIVQCTTS